MPRSGDPHGHERGRDRQRRALDAMADAARRSQAPGPAAVAPAARGAPQGTQRRFAAHGWSGAEVPPPAAEEPPAIVSRPVAGADAGLLAGLPPAPRPGSAPAASLRALALRHRQEHRLRTAIAGMAVLAVIGGAATVGALASRHPTSSTSAAPAASLHSTPPPATGVRHPSPSAAARPGGTPPASTQARGQPATAISAPAVPPGPGSATPYLTTLVPSSGPAGQPVLVAGAGIYSADGLVVGRVGGEQVPIRCPSSDTCILTVPAAPPGTSRVPVTVTTQSGTSNALWFTFVDGTGS